jgi:O-antigen/teichoic acid export membrane protein
MILCLVTEHATVTTEPAAQTVPADAVRALVGRGALYTVATGLQLAAGILVLPVVTRLLPLAVYGEVAVALVAQLVLALAAAVGLPDILARVFFKTADGPQRAASLVVLVVGSSVVVAGLALATGQYWSPAILGLDYGLPIALAVVTCVPLATLLTAQALLRAQNRSVAFLTSAAIATAGAQTTGLLLVLIWQKTATAYLTGILLGTALAAVLTVAFSGVAIVPLRDVAFVRSTLRTSLPVVLSSVALYVIWAGNRAVLTRLEGSQAAARFQVAFLVGGLTILLISAVYSAWSPIVLGAGERRWTTLAETAPVVYRMAAIAAGATALVAPLALLVIAPSSYAPRDLASTSAIVAAAAVPFAAYCANLNVVLWHGRTLALAGATAASACANVGLSFALIPRYGLNGAATGSALSYALQAVLVWLIARRLAVVPWIRPPLLQAAVGSAAAIVIAVLLPMTPLWLGIRLVAGLGLIAWLAHSALRLR